MFRCLYIIFFADRIRPSYTAVHERTRTLTKIVMSCERGTSYILFLIMTLLFNDMALPNIVTRRRSIIDYSGLLIKLFPTLRDKPFYANTHENNYDSIPMYRTFILYAGKKWNNSFLVGRARHGSSHCHKSLQRPSHIFFVHVSDMICCY